VAAVGGSGCGDKQQRARRQLRHGVTLAARAVCMSAARLYRGGRPLLQPLALPRLNLQQRRVRVDRGGRG